MASKPVLVVMAAGMGSRYGGLKQIDPVGSQGEAILDYSLYDAHKAGFDTAVIIIKEAIRKDFMDTVGQRLKRCPMEIRYAYQELDKLPAGYTVPEGRTKPWGTCHAVMCARDAIGDAPFAVINADDYYGLDAYRTMYRALQALPESGKATMVGYLLKNTASLHGTVSRGVCAVEDGMLRSVKETLKIQLYPDGSLRDLAEDVPLDPDSVVSMNYWGFMPSIFPELRTYFERFLRGEGGRNIKSECLLPVMVDDLMREGRLEVSVLHSADKWFGMTYQEDRAVVAEELRKLHENGTYPGSLRQ